MIFVTVFAKPSFRADYVTKLYQDICENYHRDMTFICLTDQSDEWQIEKYNEDIKIYPLTHQNLSGWWHKMQLFELSHQLNSPITYMDLDTKIIGNLHFLDDFDGDFAALEDFYRPSGFGSGLMRLNNGFGKTVYQPFFKDPAAAMEKCNGQKGGGFGDQRWLELTVDRPLFLQNIFPKKIVSYKADIVRNNFTPFDASIVCFHGLPRPHQINVDFVCLK